MAETAIEWTQRSWNPIVGCSIVSPGCTNCYAMKMAYRLQLMGTVAHYAGLTQKTKAGAVWTGKLALAPNFSIQEPLRRRKPTTYFVNSMGDLFHEDVPDEWIDRAFAIMALCPQHTFQILTKRASRMREYMGQRAGDWMLHWPEAVPIGKWRISRHEGMSRLGANGPEAAALYDTKPIVWPLPNVWLGVSAEDQRRADERIPELLATPAAVRFVSAEPLLGPLQIAQYLHDSVCRAFNGEICTCSEPREVSLDWIIVGGESGPGARPMHPDWPRQIRDQCAAAGTAFFFKQWGDWSPLVDRDKDDPDWRLDYSRRYSDDRPNIAWLNVAGGRGFHGDRFHIMGRGMKATAGRLLDGIEHNAMPEVRRG